MKKNIGEKNWCWLTGPKKKCTHFAEDKDSFTTYQGSETREKERLPLLPPLPPLDRTFDGPLPWPKKKPCVAPARNELNFPGGALRFYEKKGTNRSLKRFPLNNFKLWIIVPVKGT
jgi:hypothetical protein